MLRSNTTRQNKLCQSGVFLRVADTAQHLDIFWVCTLWQMSGMRVDVMPLKLVFAPAFFTPLALLDHLADRLSAGMTTFARSTFPVRVVFLRHVFPASSRHTRDGTVFSCPSAPFPQMEFFFACLTCMRGCNSWFPRANLLGTSYRTCLSRAADMGVWARKRLVTYGADKCSAPAMSNFSGGFCHG